MSPLSDTNLLSFYRKLSSLLPGPLFIWIDGETIRFVWNPKHGYTYSCYIRTNYFLSDSLLTPVAEETACEMKSKFALDHAKEGNHLP